MSHYRNLNHPNCSHYLQTTYMQHLLGLTLFSSVKQIMTFRQTLTCIQRKLKTALKNCTGHKHLPYRRGKKNKHLTMTESHLILYTNYQRQCIDWEYLDGKFCRHWKQKAFTYMLFVRGLSFQQMAMTDSK